MEQQQQLQEMFQNLRGEVSKVLVGQQDALQKVLYGFLCGGHILLEGVPGLAKTLLIQSLASAIDASFSRIQFTPDMLPGDVTGTQIFNPKEGNFSIRKGPVFANLVLADEINRAPAKVQSALLEAMQEKQVTLGGETFALPDPFLVLATQNPVEQEGTYPLPEAQLDRFMMKVRVGYPSAEEEIQIIDRMAGTAPIPKIQQVMTLAQVQEAMKLVQQVFVADGIKKYTVDIIQATRFPKQYKCAELAMFIDTGASVRASINLIKLAKAKALIDGRNYVSPHDIKVLSKDVLRHRIALSYEAQAQGKTEDDIINAILDRIEVP